MNWEQLKTILLLRWQLTRNQWARSRYGLRGVFAIIIAIGACALAAICFLGGFFGAAFGLRDAPSQVLMWVWLIFTGGFLFFWTIGLLLELQRSETIDLQRLMHLPVVLGQIFVINYIASHFAFSILAAVPVAFGLSLGLAIVRGPMMLLLLPLALSMIFMITAWTYCLRGWLAAMMTNPRRRRSIIAVLTLLIVVLAQGPNLYFNVFAHAHLRRPGALRHDLTTIEAVQKFAPPLWVSLGARALAEGRAGPALLGTVGCFVIGALGLRRAYRSTLKFYHGESGGKGPAANAHPLSTKKLSPKRSGSSLDIRLPGTDSASVVALASLRSMLRAPEVKMAWVMSFFVTVFVGGSFLFRSSSAIPDDLKPFVGLSATAFSLFVLFQLFGNLFGFDRAGFGAFVLSPINRQMILLGKNLATLPVIACSGLVFLLLTSIWLQLPVSTALAGFFQVATMSIIVSIYGNLLSICLPYRIQPGSLKPTKVPGGIVLVFALCQFLLPIAIFPVFVPPLAELLCRHLGYAAALPLNLILSVALAIATAALYWLLLPSLGRLLQRRETKILQVVTEEVE